MQLVEVAAIALPELCRAVDVGLNRAKATDPTLGDVRVTHIGVVIADSGDGDEVRSLVEIDGEDSFTSFVFPPDLDDPEIVYEKFLSDFCDWIVESRFGWGLKLE